MGGTIMQSALTDVKTLCLAILHQEEASGYEIRKRVTTGKCAYFIEASLGSIYPALARLERDGMVAGKVKNQQGRPAKKIYRITEAGRTEFQETLFSTMGNDVYRSEFLLFARFVHLLPTSLVAKRVNERLAILDEEIVELKKLLEAKSDPGGEWVIRHGISCFQFVRENISAHAHELIDMAQADKETVGATE